MWKDYLLTLGKTLCGNFSCMVMPICGDIFCKTAAANGTGAEYDLKRYLRARSRNEILRKKAYMWKDFLNFHAEGRGSIVATAGNLSTGLQKCYVETFPVKERGDESEDPFLNTQMKFVMWSFFLICLLEALVN